MTLKRLFYWREGIILLMLHEKAILSTTNDDEKERMRFSKFKRSNSNLTHKTETQTSL